MPPDDLAPERPSAAIPRRSRVGLRRVRHSRTGAAVVLVAGLAAAWIAVSAAGHARGPSAVADPTGAPVVTRTDAGTSVLTGLLPMGARCDGAPRSGAEVRCSVAGVAVDYRWQSPDAVRWVYLAVAGSAPHRPRSGPAACAHGGEDERSWSRPATPRRAAGRYACRIEQGRAAMWWTVDDRGLLAHAVAPDADLASLFAWWESHSER